jgi:hypothetical protein
MALAASVAEINQTSFLAVNFGSNGLCQYIEVANYSRYLP